VSATPWIPVAPLAAAAHARLTRRAVFECQKWDPQVGDTCTVAPVPIVLAREAWDELAVLAERLAAETLVAEAALARTPALHDRLGLPRGVRRALAAGPADASVGPRVMRFDFHLTPAGWRISEVNADVPGGLNEAGGFARLMLEHHPRAHAAGDPAVALAAALARQAGGGRVALLHATAYADDQQVMAFLASRLAAAGLRPVLASPAHLRWRDGRATLEAEFERGPVDAAVRFFPAEWLPDLPRACGWPLLLAGAQTPLTNPGSALLVQSKRFPLTWPGLRQALPTWEALLPETRDPRDAPIDPEGDWVVKPALGRVGEDVAVPGVTAARDFLRIARAARRQPDRWIAQRRFDTVPLPVAGRPMHACVGVFVLDGTAVGAYGRLRERPLIDGEAQDAAVLVADRGALETA
jgi:glutathionylspermidine synthase